MDTRRLSVWTKDISTRSWFYYGLLLLITVLAAGFRLFKLGQWSFWIDELFTLNHAMSHFSTLELIVKNIPPARNWVPVSVLLTAQMLNLSGIHEWSARLASAAIGVLTLPILYFPTRKVFGQRVALLSILLLAISPWHIFWSQNARFYTSLMLFYTLALFAFYIGIEEDKPKYLFLFFVFVYLAASERLSALFIFPVVIMYLGALWVLKFDKPKGLNIRNLAIIALPLFLGGIIELSNRIVNDESRFFADFTWFLQLQVDDPLRLLVFVGNNFGLPLMVMALFSGVFLLGRRSRPGLLMLMSALVPLVLLLVANLFIFTKDRYLFITLFAWIILAVVGIDEIASVLRGNFRWLAAGLFLVFFAHAANDVLMYYQANHGNRLQWNSAFSTVEERAREQDVIVAFWPEFHPYYVGRQVVAYEDVELDTMLASRQRYWFVLDSETIWTNGDVKDWLEDHAELIEVWYLRRPEDNYLRLYLYDPARVSQP